MAIRFTTTREHCIPMLFGGNKTIRPPQRSAHAIIDCEWGDAGKGSTTYKTVEMLRGLRPEAKIICARFSGASNAGHQVITPAGSHIFNQLPSGIIVKGNTIGVLSKLVDLELLSEELADVQSDFSLTRIKEERLKIFSDSVMIFAFHVNLNQMREVSRGAGEHGSIGRGVGEAFLEKSADNKITLESLIAALSNPQALKTKLSRILGQKKEEAQKLIAECPESAKYYSEANFKPDKVLEKYLTYARYFKDCMVNLNYIETEFNRRGASVVFEGSQGALLHPDYGPYPYVTPTNILAEAIESYSGIPLDRIEIIAVTRAYSHRHAAGPFPTMFRWGKNINPEQVNPEELKRLVDPTENNPWHGSFRSGWKDLILLRRGIELQNISIHSMVVRCLDLLDNFRIIRICGGYEGISEPLPLGNKLRSTLENARPFYSDLAGWQVPTVCAVRLSDLPENAIKYLRYLQELTGVKISAVSVGPNPFQTILLNSGKL